MMGLRYGDLPTSREIEEIERLLETLEGGDWSWRISTDAMSPWLNIDCVARAVIDAKDPTPKFAMWRYTLNIYRVGPDGAVEEDPMQVPA